MSSSSSKSKQVCHTFGQITKHHTSWFVVNWSNVFRIWRYNFISWSTVEWPNSTKNIAMQISNYRYQDTVYIFSCLRVLHPLVSFWIILRLKNSNCHGIVILVSPCTLLILFVVICNCCNAYKHLPPKIIYKKKQKQKQNKKTIVQSTARRSLPLEKNMIIANTNTYMYYRIISFSSGSKPPCTKWERVKVWRTDIIYLIITTTLFSICYGDVERPNNADIHIC